MVYFPLYGIVFGHLADVAKAIASGKEKRLNFKLFEGFSAETSGGLLVCLASEAAEAFCKEIKVSSIRSADNTWAQGGMT